MALGEYEEAKDALQRVQKIRSRIYGKYFYRIQTRLIRIKKSKLANFTIIINMPEGRIVWLCCILSTRRQFVFFTITSTQSHYPWASE